MAPIRLQKWLARCGVGSRRACEQLIRQGRVRVNGHRATLGMRIDPEQDTITVDNKPLKPPPAPLYIMLHKPPGYVTTCKDPHAPHTVMELLKGLETPVFPVGRLDADAEGLLLLTNDGELANRLLHPRYKVTKTYRVWVQGAPSESTLRQLREGVLLEEGKTAPAQVRLVKRRRSQSVLEITLHEGRKRQVKRMGAAVGHPVLRLVRVAFGPLRLPRDLPPGAWRELTHAERNALFQAAGLPTEPSDNKKVNPMDHSEPMDECRGIAVDPARHAGRY
ncbi:MAG: rRNA pseudouridine synthase [Fimbriimonadales bacterium]|nr:rRNA pseudouridine synthase [Fimbriimonadales bacterium]